jgi:spore maturation protein CgeB
MREPEQRMVFIANPTPRRRALLGQIRAPVKIFGPGWRGGSPMQHEIVSRRVSLDEVGQIYASHFATLNIMNETNVLNGLNQRNFDPCPFGAAVLSDDQPDLGLCFDVGREAFAYGSAAALDELYSRLVRAPEEAKAVGEAGRRRVMAEHTYGHRLDTLMKHL